MHKLVARTPGSRSAKKGPPLLYLPGAGKVEGVSSRGNALFVGSNCGRVEKGGKGRSKPCLVTRVDTDAAPREMLMVAFSPAEQLHWVEEGEGEAEVDKTALRGVPFNQQQVAGICAA